ncbi:Colicin-E7 immunity protein [compost metagenome]
MIFKDKLEDYTEAEFIDLLSDLFRRRPGKNGGTTEKYRIKVVKHFEVITEHPDGSDVLCFPPEGADDSPEGVTQRVKEWRAANGKPGFKPA